MRDPAPSASRGPADQDNVRAVARRIARAKPSPSDGNRIRRSLSVGIPLAIGVILAVYVLARWVGNSDPALRESPADQEVVRQVTGVPERTWQQVGAGNQVNPWHVIEGQPPLTGPNGRPELFYVGATFCEYCATERWAIVVALSRFGSFGGLSQVRSYNDHLATFSFFQSTYTSPYLDFVPVEHVGNTKNLLGEFDPLQSFRGGQQQVFDRYASTAYVPTGQGFPFIDLNNQFLIGGGLHPTVLETAAGEPMTWRQIAEALAMPTSPVAHRILGTANFMTAAICLVASQQPGNVCQGAVIREMESIIQTYPAK